MILIATVLIAIAYILYLLDAISTYIAIKKNNYDYSIEKNVFFRKIFEKYGIKKTLFLFSIIVFPIIYLSTLLAILSHTFFVYCTIVFLILEIILRISVVYNNLTGKQNIILKIFFKIPFIKDFYS